MGPATPYFPEVRHTVFVSVFKQFKYPDFSLTLQPGQHMPGSKLIRYKTFQVYHSVFFQITLKRSPR